MRLALVAGDTPDDAMVVHVGGGESGLVMWPLVGIDVMEECSQCFVSHRGNVSEG